MCKEDLMAHFDEIVTDPRVTLAAPTPTSPG